MTSGADRNQSTKSARQRSAALLALLAIIGQIIIAILPMPVMALPQDGLALCTSSGLTASPQSLPERKAPHGMPVCPVCQAGFLANSLLLPVFPAVIRRAAPFRWDPVGTSLPPPPHRLFDPHQARAPPPSI